MQSSGNFEDNAMSNPTATLTIRRVVIIAAIIVVVWQLSDVLLLAFASVLVAIILRSIAVVFQKVLPIGPNWALLLACLSILILVGGFLLTLGTQIIAESTRLGHDLPLLLSAIGNRVGIHHLDQRVIVWAHGLTSQGGVMGRITATTSVVVSGLASVLLVVVAGIYLAASPLTYRRGLLRLVPPHWRDDATKFIDTSVRALKLWLAGQLTAMLAVGLLFAIGLIGLQVPSALALGFIAGVAEFVPFAGPLLGAVPALLVAISMNGKTVLWVFVLYLTIQTVEGNLITPLIQRQAVNLAPVLTLFAIVVFGGLFGTLGLLLATPLAVLGFIAVEQFYIRDTLNERMQIPGEGR